MLSTGEVFNPSDYEDGLSSHCIPLPNPLNWRSMLMLPHNVNVALAFLATQGYNTSVLVKV